MEPIETPQPHHLRGFKLLGEQVADLRTLAANPRKRTPTGLPGLDTLILGPAPGEVFTVIARSGVGKSLVATNVMANNPTARIIFFSLEMPSHQCIQRLWSHIAKRDGREAVELINRNTIPTEVDKVATALPYQVIVDTDGLTLGDMTVYIENYEAYYGFRPDLVIIDYLEEVGGAKASGEGWTRTEATASALKGFSKREKVGVLSLHQANQKTEPWEPPVQGSAKGGGYTESDVVIGLWRPGWDPELGSIEAVRRENDLSINILKNRVNGRYARNLEYVIGADMNIAPLRDHQPRLAPTAPPQGWADTTDEAIATLNQLAGVLT
jgi:hypothetical protein